MDDLATWLCAQLNKEHALAQRLADRYRVRNPDRADNGRPYWPLRSVERNPSFVDRADPDIAAGLDLIKAYSPGRVLTEIEAKRRILDEHRPDTLLDGSPTGECSACLNDEMPCKTVRLLALPYASNPGYREEWRPDT